MIHHTFISLRGKKQKKKHVDALIRGMHSGLGHLRYMSSVTNTAQSWQWKPGRFYFFSTPSFQPRQANLCLFSRIFWKCFRTKIQERRHDWMITWGLHEDFQVNAAHRDESYTATWKTMNTCNTATLRGRIGTWLKVSIIILKVDLKFVLHIHKPQVWLSHHYYEAPK